MKRLLLIFACILGVSLAWGADQSAPKGSSKMWKEIQEYKLKFLAQEIDLKEDQKDEFVKVYTELSEKKLKNFETIKSLEKQLNDNSSDAEYKEVSDKIADLRLQDAQLEKQYDDKFAKFLTAKQIYKMKEAEEKFRKKMREMHHKKKQKK